MHFPWNLYACKIGTRGPYNQILNRKKALHRKISSHYKSLNAEACWSFPTKYQTIKMEIFSRLRSDNGCSRSQVPQPTCFWHLWQLGNLTLRLVIVYCYVRFIRCILFVFLWLELGVGPAGDDGCSLRPPLRRSPSRQSPTNISIIVTQINKQTIFFFIEKCTFILHKQIESIVNLPI